MDENLYQKLADIELHTLLEAIEILDENTIFDVDLLDGVLSINLPNNKQYIINKHNVTKKIWVSSPFSSASYFKYTEGKWLSDKNLELNSLIMNELSNFIKSNELYETVR